MKTRIFLIVFFNSICWNLQGQDIEAILKAKPLTVSGGLNSEHVFYSSNGISERRNNPYTYFLSGNMNFVFKGELSVPVSFSYSNQRFNYNYPNLGEKLNQQQFNQFGMSPKYRWVTAHAGWRNMSFSPYTLNGHIFVGGGLELNPSDKWDLALMYGRLNRAVEIDTTIPGNSPAYERIGMGAQIGIKGKEGNVKLIFFKSKDDVNSVNVPLDSVGIYPEENFVWSVAADKKVGKLSMKGEFANSLITRDQRATGSENSFIMNRNNSTVSYSAIKGNVSYDFTKFKMGLGYERISPDYKTHGAYFFNNDLENFTVNGSTSILKKKMNISANVGLQRNNLDESKISTMKRFVGSMNIGYNASEKLNLGLNYSNFQTFTNIRSQFVDINALTPYDNLDTLNFVQVSQTIGANMTYNINSDKKMRQSFTFTGTLQTTADEQGGAEQNTGNNFYNINGGYNHAIVPIDLTISLIGNANWNISPLSKSMIYGPTLSIGKSFFKKKVKSSLSSSWNTSTSEGVKTGTIFNIRWSASYVLKEKHNFTFSIVYLNREADTSNFNELTGRFGYSYNFSLKKKK